MAVNPLTRVCAVALSATMALVVAGAAGPDRAGQHGLAQAAAGDRLAPLVALDREDAAARLIGPQDAPLPPGGSQFAPSGVPPEVSRLMETVTRRSRAVTRRKLAIARRNRAHFPVDGAFNWGQDGARFGAGRGGRAHAGQDVFARAGTPLVAVRDGIVVEAGEGGGRGNYVGVYHPVVDRTYVYLHLQRPAPVSTGQRLRGGQRVGEVGCSGSCFGDHLHFEIRRGRDLAGQALDPMPELRVWTRTSRAQPILVPGSN